MGLVCFAIEKLKERALEPRVGQRRVARARSIHEAGGNELKRVLADLRRLALQQLLEAIDGGTTQCELRRAEEAANVADKAIELDDARREQMQLLLARDRLGDHLRVGVVLQDCARDEKELPQPLDVRRVKGAGGRGEFRSDGADERRDEFALKRRAR